MNTKKKQSPVKEETTDEAYVNNMFTKAGAMINTLEKVFRIDLMMAQKIDAVGGDKTGLKDNSKKHYLASYDVKRRWTL